MSRTAWQRLLAAGIVVASVGNFVAMAGPSQADATTRPNVVLVMTDDQTVESLSSMPALTGRHDLTWFDQAVAEVPLCCPSRATLLTGRYSHNTGVQYNSDAEAFDDSSTLATWLDDAGYHTAMVGKYFNGYPWQRGDTYVPPGWDDWYGIVGGSEDTAYYGYVVNDNGTLVSHGTAEPDYSTDVLAQRAVDVVSSAAAGDAPFFLWLSLPAPHYPRTPAPRHVGLLDGMTWTPPPNFNEADVSDKPAWVQARPLVDASTAARTVQREAETVMAVDEAVTRLFDTLAATGVDDTTTVVFMTDNGMSTGNHRWNGKLCPYEECIRTPLAIRLPGGAAGQHDALVSNVDIAPTIAALAGVVPPEPVDGFSLVPLLEGTATVVRDAALIHYAGNHAVPGYSGVRTPTHTYVEYDHGELELYDLVADPYQLENLAGDPQHAELMTSLASRLDELQATGTVVADPLPAWIPAAGAGALFGAHVEVDVHTGPDRRSAVAGFEELVGRPIAVERVFRRWEDPFITDDDVWSRDRGHILLLSWNSGRRDTSTYVPWADIAAGLHDHEIDARADALRAYGGPVVFVFHHEPNNGGPDGGSAGTATDYIAAYRRVHERFAAAGLTNVVHGWVLFASQFGNGTADDWYPGDDVVDLVGADGYNWYGCSGRSWETWKSPAQIFTRFRDWAVARGKPMMVAEWASGEDPEVEGRKAEWITEGADLFASWPELRIVSWFHADTNPGCVRYVDTSPSSLTAFTEMGARSWYHPSSIVVLTAPVGDTTLRDATVEFSATVADSSFHCTVDGGPAEPCTSPLTLTNMADGEHTVEIAATGGTTTGLPSRASWTVVSPAAVVAASGTAFDPATVSVPAGSWVRWDGTGLGDFTVTDSSGVGLFDSLVVPADGAWEWLFTAAGTHPYVSTLTVGAKGRVVVPLTVTAMGSDIQVLWATASAAPDTVRQVQVRPPGASSWSAWQSSASLTEAVYTPGDGAGTYEFRARTRNTTNGAVTGWSPIASFTVP